MMAKDEKKEKESAGKEKGFQPLPYLLDISLTVSQLVIVIAGAVTAFLSWYNGASLEIIALRSGVTVLCLGFLASIINRTLNQGMLDAINQPQNKNELS